MKKYVIPVFAFCVFVLQLCAGDPPAYEQRRINLRQQQAGGYSDPVGSERERLRRERGLEDKRSMFWFVPSKERRQKMATSVKKGWTGLKKKAKDFSWFGLNKKKEGE